MRIAFRKIPVDKLETRTDRPQLFERDKLHLNYII